MPESNDDMVQTSKEESEVKLQEAPLISEVQEDTEKETSIDDAVGMNEEKPELLGEKKQKITDMNSQTPNPCSDDKSGEVNGSEECQKKEAVQESQARSLSNEEVTGYTASLWKYLPVPVDEPEPAPEYINGMVDYPRSKIIAARVRGKKHKHEGTNCDDWYEVANYEDVTFIAVSDGAGSKKFSRIGSRVSCKVAIGYMVSHFEKLFSSQPKLRTDLKLPISDPKCMEACTKVAKIVQEAVVQAREAVEAAFYSRKMDTAYKEILGRELRLTDFSGTLLLTVLIPVSDDKEHLVFSCQIGDGMIALVNTNAGFENSVKLMGVADSGDFSGETDFLTSPQMKNMEKLQLRTKISRTSMDTVMVMSDGVSDDYYPNETQMSRLYFDLVVNGILDMDSTPTSMATLTQEQVKLIRHIPDPQIYPWVNDQTIKIPIQYTKRILESTGLTLEDLWNDRIIINLARLEMVDEQGPSDPSEKLKVWLDNYVERGSFDDRTLVVVTV